MIKRIALGRKAAKYKNGMTPDEIRAIEMTMRSEDLNEEQRTWGVITERGTERFYYVVEDEIIGASLGEETNIVKVHRLQSGEVHSYPITRTELERELKKHNQEERQHFRERWPQ